MFRICLSVCVVLMMVFAATPIHAAEKTIDGIIKSVDATKRTISVTDKDKTLDLELSKNTKITGMNKPLNPSSLQSGQSIKLKYHDALGIVLEIDVLSAIEKKPELVVLNELDVQGEESNPFLSPDGLKIYFTIKEQSQQTRWVWTAKRRDAESLFENPKRLIPAMDFTVSDDGLEMILFLNRGLYQTTRNTVEDNFKRPTRIPSAVIQNGFLAGPCLSSDGLTLYCDSMQKGVGPQIQVMTRKTKSSNWSKPEPLQLTPIGKMKYPYVSSDGKYLFCTGKDISQGSNIIIHSGKDAEGGFHSASVLNVDGLTVRGIFPRYVAATNELFFAGESESGGELKLMVLKNFDLEKVIPGLK
ncbi:PD40 domain-containing protein [Gimesia panareensis]|uniref:PD40 domain-containing protein n=1 Tax=Gimesia panareensis TaxID=2527978 RepID=UPI001188E12B|nr:PD40 domain-containing protein [Gimesia panareensis]QDU50482.1 WD40-like Beta Propeller Repeat protein [Gimesia panareensis]